MILQAGKLFEFLNIMTLSKLELKFQSNGSEVGNSPFLFS